MITTYQIRNVLRIYGNQLKKRTMLMHESAASIKQPSDFVDISVEARKKQMYAQISDNLVSQITRNNYQSNNQEGISKE